MRNFVPDADRIDCEVGGVDVINMYESGCEPQGPFPASGPNVFSITISHGELLGSPWRRADNGDLYKAQIEETISFSNCLFSPNAHAEDNTE